MLKMSGGCTDYAYSNRIIRHATDRQTPALPAGSATNPENDSPEVSFPKLSGRLQPH
jgi:hypothetical protein